MEAAGFSKTTVSYCNIKHHKPEDLNLNLHSCENLKSCIRNLKIKLRKAIILPAHMGVKLGVSVWI